MKWTDAQNSAINTTGNLIVSAAAGSGKTAVLTERIVQTIAAGADIDELLVVTFTRAAAEEMKKRIERRLRTYAEEVESTELRIRLRAQALRIGAANISTIHAFCMKLLRKYFNVVGLDPAFRAATETETAVMSIEAHDEALESLCAQDVLRAHEALATLGGERRFLDAVKAIIETMNAMPDPLSWLDDSIQSYSLSAEKLNDSEAAKAILLYVKRIASAILAEYDRLISFTYADFPEVCQLLDSDKTQCLSILNSQNLNELIMVYHALSFDRLPRTINAKSYWSGEEHELFKKRRDNLKNLLKKVAPLIPDSLESCETQNHALIPAISFLAEYITLYSSIYADKKLSAGIIDYPDMEHLTLTLLSRPEIAAACRRQLKYIFIDEYQDSNRVQEEIISRICQENNLFLVGDVKQSIYRFRLADPTLFISRYDRYRLHNGGEAIDLNANFRSSSGIINAINSIFSVVMHRDTYEIEYDEAAALKLGRDDASHIGDAKALIIDHSNPIETDELFESLDTETAALTRDESETLAALAEIRRILKYEEYTDPKSGQKRPYTYADIAILVRSNSTAIEVVRILSLEGVPAYSNQAGGYMESLEVQVFMNLLRVIDNNRQDIPLISIMRSEMGGFDVSEIAMIRTFLKKEPFIDAVRVGAEYNTPLGAKLRAFLQRLDVFKKDYQLFGIQELIGRLFDETGYYRFVSVLPGGEKRKANLDSLLENARTFEARKRQSLHSFIEFYDVLRESSGMYTGVVPSVGVDAVRVMTIHKSKGLEFPVVILLNAGKAFIAPTIGDKSAAMCNVDTGIGVIHFDVKKNTRTKSIFYTAAECYGRLKNISEELRLMYVAMTRAIERLYIVGSVLNLHKKLDAWANDAFSPLNVNSQLGFIMPVVMNSPDGNKLRHKFNIPLRSFGSSNMAVDSINLSSHSLSGSSITPKDFDAFTASCECDSPMPDFLYPYDSAAKTPSKLTVSELSLGNTTELRELPSFIKDKKPLTAAEKGSAMHKLIQCISIKPHTSQSICDEIEQLIKRGILTQKEGDAINVSNTLLLTQSEIWARMCRSNDVRREMRFNYNAIASQYLDTDYDGTFILQGMIDCCFMENGKWILIDFKTDYVKDDVYSAAMVHKTQLSLYADALFGMTGIEVSQQYVYLLSVAACVRVDADT